MKNALTIDVEDYYHVHAYAGVIDPARWDEYPSRVVESTETVLSTLGKIRATMFVLGHVARRHPEIVRRIVSAGHELASHGEMHQRVDSLSRDQFRCDIRTAKRRLEDLAGVDITAYRAPSFSITQATPWAHEMLVEEGYTVDSSMAAGRHGRSLHPISEVPFVVETPAGPLWEFPLPAWHGLPIGGGGYLRLLPYFLTRRALRKVHQPFCVYLHPWELDPDQPRLTAPARQVLRHRIGLKSTAKKLKRLLGDFQFGTLTDVLQQWTTWTKTARTDELKVAA